MSILIRNLCVIGILSGLIISAMPDSAVKQIAKTFAICVCVLIIVTALKDFDYGQYASQLARYKELEYTLSEKSSDAVSRLNRRVIEEESSSYIVHEAARAGIPLDNAVVEAQWNVSGYWVPYSAVVYGEYSKDIYNTIVCDLGIPGERITWIN